MSPKETKNKKQESIAEIIFGMLIVVMFVTIIILNMTEPVEGYYKASPERNGLHYTYVTEVEE